MDVPAIDTVDTIDCTRGAALERKSVIAQAVLTFKPASSGPRDAPPNTAESSPPGTSSPSPPLGELPFNASAEDWKGKIDALTKQREVEVATLRRYITEIAVFAKNTKNVHKPIKRGIKVAQIALKATSDLDDDLRVARAVYETALSAKYANNTASKSRPNDRQVTTQLHPPLKEHASTQTGEQQPANLAPANTTLAATASTPLYATAARQGENKRKNTSTLSTPSPSTQRAEKKPRQVVRRAGPTMSVDPNHARGAPDEEGWTDVPVRRRTTSERPVRTHDRRPPHNNAEAKSGRKKIRDRPDAVIVKFPPQKRAR